MINAIEQLTQSLNKIRAIAETGHHIAVDQISRMQFEQIIRETGNYEDWKKKQADTKQD
jgi:hypothetical protein